MGVGPLGPAATSPGEFENRAGPLGLGGLCQNMTRYRLTVDDYHHMAESSLAYDLGVKVPLYARHGIPEVWVIDAATRTTHRFRKPRPEGYSEQGMITPEELLACLALPGEAKNLATILPLGRSERV